MSLHSAAGFTLLELLATLTIIALLTLIAVPQYKEYRARGYDTMARVDLRNIAIAEEAYYYDAERYFPCNNENCSNLPGIARLSAGTQISIEATEDDFSGRSFHTQGTGRIFRWNSNTGGMQ